MLLENFLIHLQCFLVALVGYHSRRHAGQRCKGQAADRLLAASKLLNSPQVLLSCECLFQGCDNKLVPLR